MEIRSFKVVEMQTHMGNEFFKEIEEPDIQSKTYFRVEAEVIDENIIDDHINYKEKREVDLEHSEENSEYTKMSRSEYHSKYGLLTFKQFTTRMKELMTSFHASKKMADKTKRMLRSVWILKQIYECVDNSMGLLLARIKMLLVNAYQQMVVFKRENLPNSKNKLGRYVQRTLNVMERVCGKIIQLFASRPDILFILNQESKQHFFENATPCMLAKIGYLQKNRWIDESMVPIITPKYYRYWNFFWKEFVLQYFKLGEDISGRIAEFIPTRIEGSTFLDLFRKKFDLESKSFSSDNFTFTYSVSHDQEICYNNITVFLKPL
uniref:Uncharacterized protein n=1 Tax=viral metagenome TaxID=1070528 RepID=A0A6C0HTC1_9ZZZZ